VTRIGTGAARAASAAPLAQVRLGLDGHDLLHAGWIVREVEPVPGADLDDPADEAVEQLPAELGLTSLLVARGEASE
jgi:hypothetical protein